MMARCSRLCLCRQPIPKINLFTNHPLLQCAEIGQCKSTTRAKGFWIYFIEMRSIQSTLRELLLRSLRSAVIPTGLPTGIKKSQTRFAMLFNSLHFFIFFPFVTLAYFWCPQRFRWLLLLLASVYFYMAFIPVYVLILFFTIIIDYFAGILIERTRKKSYLVMSIIANVSVLFVFKYYNFFMGEFGFSPLSIILPIGLSFHTFQAMSYTIEVFRGFPAERHFGKYALYVMFFPQLVAGPIERPQNLLHQFSETHTFSKERLKEGLQLMGWGFFKKIVIADNLGLV